MRLDYSKLTAIIDTREQKQLNLAPMRVVKKGLATGDYTLQGLEDLICIERKELSDLIGCMTSRRTRFEKELHRMKSYQFKMVVVEADYTDIAMGNYRSKLSPISATHSIGSWQSKYNVPFMFLGDAANAGEFVKFYMYTTAQRLVGKYNVLAKSILGDEV